MVNGDGVMMDKKPMKGGRLTGILPLVESQWIDRLSEAATLLSELAETDPVQEVEVSCEEFELACPYCDGYHGNLPQHQTECPWLRARIWKELKDGDILYNPHTGAEETVSRDDEGRIFVTKTFRSDPSIG